MKLIVTLHGQHAATLDAGDDRWLHARTTSMGAMSARISAAWTEKPATRQLNCWLDGCLPENGLLARYRARAQSMLQAAGVAYETPKVAEILWANADAEFAGAVRLDTDRSPSAADVSGYERLTESEIGNRLGDPSRETLASDGHEIRYPPKWVADTDAHVIETAMARVVMACALKHHTRRGHRDLERWQLASQLVTHALLRDSGFTLPPDAEAWDGVSVEQAYDRLPEPQEDDSGGDSGSPSVGGDMGAGAAAAASGGADEGVSDSPSDSSAEGGDETQDGSGEGGNSYAPASHDPSGTGEIMDAGARGDGAAGESPVDVTAEEQAWDEAMHQAMNLARAEGKLPGGVEETVRNAHASTLDWRTLLRRYMTDAARCDYSWSFPNRRFIDGGLYLPSIRSEGIDAIAVIIDTSGSLPAQTLADFWAEVREVSTEIQTESVHILQVDAALQEAAEYAACDLPDEIVIKGRGGTDFRPGFAWLDEQGIQPSVCLYLTDMLCSSYPDAEPAFPVLWANYSEPPGDWNREPWGERIDIADI